MNPVQHQQQQLQQQQQHLPHIHQQISQHHSLPPSQQLPSSSGQPNHPHIHQPMPHQPHAPVALHADELPDVSGLSVAAVAAAAMSDAILPPGTSTSSSTINPTTPQSSLKE
ncbi:hypothetical protein LPJ56_006011 [Coemansia sp. RSA 2599]|nr:hypothetical protein LPJ56_006011 [Coemansia sp. RSA 2599]